MNTFSRHGVIAALVVPVLLACQLPAASTPGSRSPAIAAVLKEPVADVCREALQNASNNLVNGTVQLAPDAWLKVSDVPLNRSLRNEQGQQLGKQMNTPDVLRLVMAGKVCMLEHSKTLRRASLTACDCKAASL